MGISSTTPLTTVQLEQFTTLVNSLNREQLAWISGYLAAISSQSLAIDNKQPDEGSAASRNSEQADAAGARSRFAMSVRPGACDAGCAEASRSSYRDAMSGQALSSAGRA